MTVGMDDGKFYLIDNFPGIVTNGNNPSDWTAASATEDFAVGTKRAIYDDTNNGWAVLCYLQYVEDGNIADCDVKSPCAPSTASAIAAGSWYKVTNDGTLSFNNGPIAIALGSVTDEYYGWFWVGGVCPVDTISGLGGVFASDDSITAGVAIMLQDSCVNDFAIFEANTTGIVSGFALAADANAT